MIIHLLFTYTQTLHPLEVGVLGSIDLPTIGVELLLVKFLAEFDRELPGLSCLVYLFLREGFPLPGSAFEVGLEAESSCRLVFLPSK